MIKKILLALILTVATLFTISAKDWQESSLSYTNVPIYRVINAPDVYIVYYAKYGLQVGQVSIPKRWVKRSAEVPAKLKIRALPVGVQPYLTLVTKDKEFSMVYLTVPTDHTASTWDQVDNLTRYKDDGKETLEIELR